MKTILKLIISFLALFIAIRFLGCSPEQTPKQEVKQYYLRLSDIPESRYDSTLKAWIPTPISVLEQKFLEAPPASENLPEREVRMKDITTLPQTKPKHIDQGISGNGGSSCIVCSGYKICIVEIPDHCHIYMGDGCITIWCDGKDPRGTCCDEQWRPIIDPFLPQVK